MAFGSPKIKVGGLAALGRRDEDAESVEVPVPASIEEPRADGLERIEGKIERAIFASSDGTFAIYIASITAGNGSEREISLQARGGVKFQRGDPFVATGSWTTYKGKPQFKAVSARQPEIKGNNGIVSWLSTGAIAGVGEMTAKRLLAYFGENLEAAMSDPVELQKSGIMPSRAEAIAQRWNENRDTARLFSFLAGVGLGESLSARIFKKFGLMAESIIRANPWHLSESIAGIAFLTADMVAKQLGCQRDSKDRITAGLRHVLKEYTFAKGNCGVKEYTIVRDAAKLLDIDTGTVKECLEAFYERQIGVLDNGLVYLPAIHLAETRFSTSLLDRLHCDSSSIDPDRKCGPLSQEDAEVLLEEEAAKLDFSLDESQREACIMALTNRVCIITGGPGTGKSTIQKLIGNILRRVDLLTLGAAPTGRAAKRQEEASSIPSSTMHRLIGRDPVSGGPLHHQDNPLDLDWLIIDEQSMVDIQLADMVEGGLPKHACVTFVGDADQLTSVGPGQVLHDLIKSGVIPVAVLNQAHRQINGDGGGIVVAASRINMGEIPIRDGETLKGFHLIDESDESAMIDIVERLLREDLPAAGYEIRTDVQILVSMRKGECGMNNLNSRLREIFNPSDSNPAVTIGNHTYAIGDRVMHLQNDYTKAVFNGELGTVCGFDEIPTGNGKSQPVMTVDYSGWKVVYTRSDMTDVELAFAGTVHKAQGCEHKVVIFLAPREHTHMLVREQIYTGVTRAKSQCFVIGDIATIERGVKQRINGARSTGLVNRLRGPEHSVEQEAKSKMPAMPTFTNFGF